MNGAYAPPLTAPPAFAGRQSRGDSKEGAAAPNYYQRGGISMTEDEAYKVHIQYTFNAFCNGYVIDKNEYLGEPYLTFGIRLIKTLM